jgi:hypothetical protein
MDITEVISVSEMLDPRPKNDTGQIHTLKQHEGAHQAAYEAGMAAGKEEGYRRGYQEGFSDCYKLGNPAHKVAPMPDAPKVATKKAEAMHVIRLRGLPCANCGCCAYSDEAQCPSCGTLKTIAAGEQATLMGDSAARSPRNRRGRRQT